MNAVPTRALLAAGAAAGPLYCVMGVAQALARDGFDLTRHPLSLLSTGAWGWVQIANFVAAGALVIAFAVGMRRVWPTGRGATWAPRLLGIYGAGLVGAGVFVADPADGFPPGTPAGAPDEVTWHGALHFVTSGIGFAALVAACLLLARRFAAGGETRWAVFSAAVGILFLVGFAAVAAGTGHAAATVGFGIAVLLVWVWITAVAAHLLSRTPASTPA
jgi:hypothetical protein